MSTPRRRPWGSADFSQRRSSASLSSLALTGMSGAGRWGGSMGCGTGEQYLEGAVMNAEPLPAHVGSEVAP